MLKSLFKSLLIASLFGLTMLGGIANAQPVKPVTLYLFYGDGCPHCAKEEEFLAELVKEDRGLKVVKYEIWKNRENAALLSQVAKELKISASGVPVTIVGRQSLIGFDEAETTGGELRQMIDSARTVGDYEDVVAKIKGGEQPAGSEGNELPLEQKMADNDKTVNSIFGKFSIKDFSLPALTVLIAVLDSFNPCAMWVLLFLISLLFGMNDRRKMWIYGSAFILGTALACFIFLTAWLNLFLFIGYVSWIRILIGLFAIGSGVYNLRKYWINRNGGCDVTDEEDKKKIMQRLKAIVTDSRTLAAAGGILLLAGSINMIGLVCSAGLPAIYIQALMAANLTGIQYYAYILLYVLFFVMNQVVVFLLAMFTMEIKAVSSRVTKYATLFAGVIMLFIGLMMLFNPSALSF